jgi:trk system potassium uptake protein TrkH
MHWLSRHRHSGSLRGRFAPYVLGTALIGLALILAAMELYALVLHDPLRGFAVAALVAAGAGLGLRWLGARNANPSRRETLASVLLIWLCLPLVGALPFLITGHLSPLNALFESMSGFTTTGATVLANFEAFPRSLHLWRTQWFGGVGIIVLFVAVLPHLALVGRQMFLAEAPGPTSDDIVPRLRGTANAVLSVYLGLTIACGVAYLVGGMTPFEAAAHALTTLSAGGFSPNGLSFAAYDSPFLGWSAIVFMAFAGANFALLYRVFRGRPGPLLRSSEFRIYLAVSVGVGLLLAGGLLADLGVADALRHGLFQALSIITTTGFASVDFALWPEPLQLLLVVLMFIGGSAGSAAGGIKIVRWLIIAESTRKELHRLAHPRGIFLTRVDGQRVPIKIVRAVEAFVTLYILLVALSAVVLVALGTDFVTALTASLAAVGNIGPGLAGVGPLASFADLPALGRGLLIFDMYAGRLEVVTVFAIFEPDWWLLPHRWTQSS